VFGRVKLETLIRPRRNYNIISPYVKATQGELGSRFVDSVSYIPLSGFVLKTYQLEKFPTTMSQ
jgi:hypothetical protein